jgi:UPF0716 protein FxsA
LDAGPFRSTWLSVRRLILLLPFVFLLDLFLLVWIAERIGGGNTLLFVIASALVGVAMARREGSRVWQQFQQARLAGETPDEGLASGVLVLLGGVFFVIPGVITDLAGLVLLIPATRRAVAGAVRRRFAARVADGTVRVVTFSQGTTTSHDVDDDGPRTPPIGPNEDGVFTGRLLAPGEDDEKP